MSEAPAAARLGDPVGHGLGMVGMLAGAVAGVALVVAGTLTGGAAIVMVAAAAAAGGGIMGGIQTFAKLPDPTTGMIKTGSPSVHINNLAAVRAVDDTGGCHGLYGLNHPAILLIAPIPVAEGAKTVHFNNQHAGRVTSRLMCGAKIKSGSGNVWIGGPTATDLLVIDTEAILHWALMGVVLIGGGWLVVAPALAAGGVGAAILAGAEFAAQTAVWLVGLDALGKAVDARYGPGSGAIVQNLVGLGLVGAGVFGKGPAVGEELPVELTPGEAVAEPPAVTEGVTEAPPVEENAQPGRPQDDPSTPSGSETPQSAEEGAASDPVASPAGGESSGPQTASEELSDLGPLAGKSRTEIETMLTERGYTRTDSRSGEGSVWTRPMPDGNTAAVRLDPASPATPKNYADEVAHAHKELVSTSDVDATGNYDRAARNGKYGDDGVPTKDRGAHHIPILWE